MIPIYLLNKVNVKQAAKTLKESSIIAHPADTCYGLAGLLGKQKVLKKMQTLKGRDGQKPISLMFFKELWSKEGERYAQLDEHSKKICQALFPGPITLILPKGPAIPEWYFPETNLIGIRVPEDQNCQMLLKGLDDPILTTSANLSGELLCQTAEEIQKAFKNQTDTLAMILKSPTPVPQKPSTVILIQDKEINILREGPWSKTFIEQKLKD